MERDFSEFEFTVRESRALSEQERGELLRLFELNYRQANPAFLEKSLATLRHSALAFREGVAVGFGVAETRVMDLPRLPAQVVSLAGICCVVPEFRRRGLFGDLTGEAEGPIIRAAWGEAGAIPAFEACSSCTSHASPVGSATDSTLMPVSLVKPENMCLSNESLK